MSPVERQQRRHKGDPDRKTAAETGVTKRKVLGVWGSCIEFQTPLYLVWK